MFTYYYIYNLHSNFNEDQINNIRKKYIKECENIMDIKTYYKKDILALNLIINILKKIPLIIEKYDYLTIHNFLNKNKYKFDKNILRTELIKLIEEEDIEENLNYIKKMYYTKMHKSNFEFSLEYLNRTHIDNICSIISLILYESFFVTINYTLFNDTCKITYNDNLF